MISQQAKLLREALQRDSLDNDYQNKRLEWESAARLVPTPPDVEVRTVVIGGVPCMLHSVSSQFPGDQLVLYIHGGGLVEGSIQTSREWCARLCKACDTTVLSIDYRLAPEHPYPAGLDDVLAVYGALDDAWSGCVVKSIGADSSGCNLLMSALFKLREAEAELPLSLFLLSPSIDLLFTGESHMTNNQTDLLVSNDVLKHYANLYAEGHQLNDPLISPLYGTFEHMPPMHIHVDASEVLLNDATRLKEYAEKAGCSVELIESKGLWHVWPMFGDFPEAHEAITSIAKHIG